MSVVGSSLGGIAGFALLTAVELDETSAWGPALVFGLVGVIAGVALGLVVGLVTAAALVLVRRRARTPRIVEIMTSAMAAAAVTGVIVLVAAEFTPDAGALLFCTVLSGFPAALTAGWLSRKPARSVGHG